MFRRWWRRKKPSQVIGKPRFGPENRRGMAALRRKP